MDALLHAIAEPRRRRILTLVRGRELTAGEIARRLGVTFDTPVTVDPSLAGEAVSGEFGADGLEDALSKLALVLGARVEADGAGFRIVE